MSAFKEINSSETSVSTTITHKTQNLDSGSTGVHFIKVISGSTEYSGSNKSVYNYWNSVHNLFYLSGSPKWKNLDNYQYNNFASPFHSFGSYNVGKTNYQFRHKFHNTGPSGSILSIPQQYFGERIKPGTFEIDDTSTSTTIKLRDDGHGNLYAVGNTVSQSTNHASSSENYIGNIFYDFGLITIDETGSYDSTATYMDMGTKYKFKFDSTTTIPTKEWVVRIRPREFNSTLNWSARGFESVSKADVGSEPYKRATSKLSSPHLLPQLTGSKFNPYITQIHLYDSNYPWEVDIKTGIKKLREPLVIANVPRPVKMSDKLDIVIKIRLDF